MRLAVIGAGVRGSSTAYFVHRQLPSLDVTIYDRSDRVGGRVYGVEVDDEWVEVGASFFKGGHRLLPSLLSELGIEASTVRRPSSVGVWNGERFVLWIKNPVVAAVRLLIRFPRDILRLNRMLNDLSRRSRTLYGEVERNPGEWGDLYDAAELTGWLRKPLREALLEKSVSPRFIHDVVEPVTRVIYNQGDSMNAYAGLFAVNILKGKTFKVASGNEIVPVKLAMASGAEVRLNADVKEISMGSGGRYTVSGEGFSEEYDAVVIANPDACSLTPEGCPPFDYQRVYVRVVRGTLKASYFGLPHRHNLPETIVSTREVPWTHVIRLSKGGDQPLYSVASPAPIDYLGEMFDGHEVVFEHDWEEAYPVLGPVSELPKCRVGRLIYYPNCSESAISAMEPSILSALNCVYVLRRDLDH